VKAELNFSISFFDLRLNLRDTLPHSGERNRKLIFHCCYASVSSRVWGRSAASIKIAQPSSSAVVLQSMKSLSMKETLDAVAL